MPARAGRPPRDPARHRYRRLAALAARACVERLRGRFGFSSKAARFPLRRLTGGDFHITGLFPCFLRSTPSSPTLIGDSEKRRTPFWITSSVAALVSRFRGNDDGSSRVSFVNTYPCQLLGGTYPQRLAVSPGAEVAEEAVEGGRVGVVVFPGREIGIK